MKDLFVYIDPGFLEGAGHYTTVAENLRRELDRRGIEMWHFVNNEVSNAAVRRHHLERLFIHKAILKEIDQRFVTTTPPWKLRAMAAVKSVLDPARTFVKKHRIRLPVAYPPVLEQRAFVKSEEDQKLEAFGRALENVGDRILARGDLDRNVAIFMYNCHPLYFPIFADVFSQPKFVDLRLAIHLNLFYLNPEFCRNERAEEYIALLKTVGHLLEWKDPSGRIHLYADSERTINAYRKYFRRAIDLIPVPVLPDEGSVSKPPQKNPSALTIGYFGYPSTKQGYPFVLHLYDSLIGRHEFDHVQFVVRHNDAFASSDMAGAVSDFRKRTLRIRHLTGFLSQAEYREALSGCDIVLIPHSSRDYPTQTSGLFVEALGEGKIVVAPQNTWMDDQLRRFGSGKTFDSNSYESFEGAVVAAIRDFPEHGAEGLRGINEVRRIHSAANLLDTLGRQVSSVIPLTAKEREMEARRASAATGSPLRKLKNLHKGQRCFVVGNGPSLNRMNLELLSREYVICSNAFFLMFPRISWRPQYYTAVDTRVVPDRAADIIRMHEQNPGMVLFFPVELVDHQTHEVTPTGRLIPPAPNRYYFAQRFPQDDDLPYSAFSYDPESALVQPYTVSITALQLAAFLGFDPIYLIGCDTEYSIPSSVLQEGIETDQGKMFYTSTVDDDANHFDPSYFGKGRKWHNPQVEKMLWHYRIAHEALAILGRRVYNAGVGGKLEEFPRIDFESVVG